MTAESDISLSAGSPIENAALAARPRDLWAVPAFSGLIVVASHLPLLFGHFGNLWATDRYRCFLFLSAALVCLALLRLAWAQRLVWAWRLILLRRFGWNPTESSTPQAANFPRWLTASCIVLTAAVLLWSPWLSAVSGMLACRPVLLHLGNKYGQRFTMEWLLLWLLVPLPLGLDIQFVDGLLGGVARWNSWLLDFFGYPHLLVGHTIHTLSGGQVVADEACHGMRLLFELTACTALFVVWTRRPRAHSLLLLLLNAFWGAAMAVIQLAIAVRTAFVALGTVVGEWDDIIVHLGLLALGMFMVLSTDRLLIFLLLPARGMRRESSQESLAAAKLPAPSTSAGLPANEPRHGITWGFAILIVVQLVELGCTPWMRSNHLAPRPIQAPAFDAKTVPQDTYGWQRLGFSLQEPKKADDTQVSSAVWTYQKSGSQATVSCGFPRADWRSPVSRFRGRGWDSVGSLAHTPEHLPDSGDLQCVALALRDKDCQPGLLFHSVMDAKGRVMPPPGMAGLSISWWLRSLRDRMQRRAADFGWRTARFEFQVFVRGRAAVDPVEQQQVGRAFAQWRELVGARLAR